MKTYSIWKFFDQLPSSRADLRSSSDNNDMSWNICSLFASDDKDNNSLLKTDQKLLSLILCKQWADLRIYIDTEVPKYS